MFHLQAQTGHEFTPTATELSLDWLSRWLGG
jgi:hypothetical protein